MTEKFLHHGYLSLPAKRSAALDKLNSFFTIYEGASPVDRTGTIAFPTRMKSVFPLPRMQSIGWSYAELCRQRAVSLLQLAQQLDVELCVFWSGGVDSTCALVSLLEFDRERIVVLLDEQSIAEYPSFYFQHIAGKLRIRSASSIVDVFEKPRLVVNGEHNDQLFGSDIIGEAISLFGVEAVLGRLQRELITSLYEYKLNGDREMALFFSGLFGLFTETAPLPLRTNFDLLWWINFAVKWQCVYMRSLIFSQSALTPERVSTYYHPFFGTSEFQLWSLNNPDQKIRNDWRSYKWPAKDIIFQYTKDADYRDNKLKRKSLAHLVDDCPFHRFLDENFHFREEMDWYEPNAWT